MYYFIKLITIFTIIFANIFSVAIAASDVNNFNNIASYLSGEDSPQDHKIAMNALWDEYEKSNLNNLRIWQKQEIALLPIIKNCNLFYPFSGPDIVHMMTLFPHCHSYIMVGLEPTGSILKLSKEKLNLPHLRSGLHSLLNRSFFVTREMWGDFAVEKNGLLTPMLALLKRMKFSVQNVEQVYLSDKGILAKNVKVGNGIKITCKHPDNKYVQEIYYFRKSLVGPTHGVNKFISQDRPLITYLKAAQYTLFDPRFALIRQTILNKSSLVLEDDSGVPYRFLNNKNWDIEYYGYYDGPYGLEFKPYFQHDLKKTYQDHLAKSKNNVTNNHQLLKPMPFSLGYGYKRINTILIKAQKSNKPKK